MNTITDDLAPLAEPKELDFDIKDDKVHTDVQILNTEGKAAVTQQNIHQAKTGEIITEVNEHKDNINELLAIKNNHCTMWFNGTGSVPAWTEAIIPFNTITIDPLSQCNTGNHRITVAADGVYVVYAQVRNDLSDSYFIDIYIRINGVIISGYRSLSGSGNTLSAACSAMKNCAAGDYFTAHIYNGSPHVRTLYGGYYTQIWANRIS